MCVWKKYTRPEYIKMDYVSCVNYLFSKLNGAPVVWEDNAIYNLPNYSLSTVYTVRVYDLLKSKYNLRKDHNLFWPSGDFKWNIGSSIILSHKNYLNLKEKLNAIMSFKIRVYVKC